VSWKLALDCRKIPRPAANTCAHGPADIAGRVYNALACIEFLDTSAARQEKNPRRMLEMFNDLPQDIGRRSEKSSEKAFSKLLEFLNTWGLWSSDRGYELFDIGTFPGIALLFPDLIWEQQKKYGLAQSMSHHAWLKDSARLPRFGHIDSFPYFMVESSHCEETILTQITIHHLERAKFGRCKRKDCRKPFVCKTKQRRFYCSNACAHLANVREMRSNK